MTDTGIWMLSQLINVLIGTLLMACIGWLYGKRIEPAEARTYALTAAIGAFLAGVLYTLLRLL